MDQINIEALFCDETENFIIPSQVMAKERYGLKFRCAADDKVSVYAVIKEDGAVLEKIYELKKIESDSLFDYYSVDIDAGSNAVHYYFKVCTDTDSLFFNRKGVSEEYDEKFNFCLIPDFTTPDWAKGAVMYQIFTDRFCEGDKSNSVQDAEYTYLEHETIHVKDWEKPPENVWEFYGGDLLGVINKMAYLKDLGIEVIYFNPLFVSPSNHKYDIQDYEHIDPHFGVITNVQRHKGDYRDVVTNIENLEASDKLFIELVDTAHKNGIRVIIDGVFNHCGSFNRWLDREKIYEGQTGFVNGAYSDPDSIYSDFFDFAKNDWPDNDSYDGWWGHKTLPKLNYESSDRLCSEIFKIGRKWVSPPYNADGWRLDVAADLGHSKEFNHKFWKMFRKEVKSVKPDVLILAEHYGNPKEWLMGDEWDTIMNYDAFMEPVTWFLTGMEKHSDGFDQLRTGDAEFFKESMIDNMNCFTVSSLQCSMNQLSNHDHSRFLTRTNKKVGRVEELSSKAASQDIKKGLFRAAVVILMTWPGAPTLYYGDEAGVCGFTDPDNRRTYPWGREDKQLIAFHRDIIKIHKENRVLTYGSLIFLKTQQDLLVYGRFNKTEKILVIININPVGSVIDIPVWKMGIEDGHLHQIMFTVEEGYDVSDVSYKVDAGIVKIDIAGGGSKILKQ